MTQPVYDLRLPKSLSTAVVFASPHSGRDYPRDFLRTSVLNETSVRSSEDAFVDQLFDRAPEYGAPLLAARVPRAYLDLNRSPDELDPALIDGVRQRMHSPRIASGLGVVPRVVANGRSIYQGKLTLDEARRRIEHCWVPYHKQLQHLLDNARRQFGKSILIDCHSMPHEAVDVLTRQGLRRPEVVIGDRFGAAADSEIVERIEATFRDAGLHVTRNSPFAGAYIVQHYGRPARQQHAIQIEIDRSLYMNEQLIRPNNNFETMRKLIEQVIAQAVDLGRSDDRLAAE